MNETRFTKDACDSCNYRGRVLLYFHCDTPVLTQCRACAPKDWDRLTSKYSARTAA